MRRPFALRLQYRRRRGDPRWKSGERLGGTDEWRAAAHLSNQPVIGNPVTGGGMARTIHLEATMRLALMTLALVHLAAADTARDLAWQQDLDTLSTQLPRLHPNLFFQVSRADWNQAVAELRAAVPQLSDVEVMAGMARVVALVGDGHTNLFLTQRNPTFRMLPLQMRWFEDGLFITGGGPAYARAAGARVVQIGSVPLDQAYQAVSAIISHENDSWVREESPVYLVNADLLQALKIAPSNQTVTFVLEDAKGQFTLDVASLNPESAASLANAPDPGTGFIPLWRQHANRNYWFTYVESSRTLYFGYNACLDMSDLPFAQFNIQLWQTFDANPVERFVLDLRNNNGGNSGLIQPFINSGLARQDRLASVQMAAIIGRATFSSGILNAMTVHQGPILLYGEASGGSPNSYGEVLTLVLPNSRLNVNYSTRYFQFPVPNGPLMPDVAVKSYSADYFARHDPFLAAVFAGTRPDTPTTPIAPGALASSYVNFGVATAIDAGSLPLPKQLGNVEVLVNGRAAPLLAVRPAQVNFQVPAATEIGVATVMVRRDGSEVASYSATVTPAAPTVFAAVGSGSVCTIYATGQGATDPPVDDGVAPVAIANSRLTPRVYAGAEQTEVLFSGLSAPFPGLWQINVRVPANPSGEVPVFVAAAGLASNGTVCKVF
jgi:uncharacterized protein (TIGR03437 family)